MKNIIYYIILFLSPSFISTATFARSQQCLQADQYGERVGNWMNNALKQGGALNSLQITAGGLEAIVKKYEQLCPDTPELPQLQASYKSALQSCGQISAGTDDCSPQYPDFYQSSNRPSNAEQEIAALLKEQTQREKQVQQTQAMRRQQQQANAVQAQQRFQNYVNNNISQSGSSANPDLATQRNNNASQSGPCPKGSSLIEDVCMRGVAR